MTGFEFYAIFALATAFSSLYEIVRVARLRAGPEADVNKNPITAYTVMFVFSLVLAPVMFPIVLSTRLSDAAIKGLLSN